MSYDVAAVRTHFPALLEGAAHFDGPGGTQTPDTVAAAVAGVLTAAVANRGTVTAAERRAESCVVEARAVMGDLLGLDPGGIVFGRSATELTLWWPGRCRRVGDPATRWLCPAWTTMPTCVRGCSPRRP